jgi:hypothetical protein
VADHAVLVEVVVRVLAEAGVKILTEVVVLGVAAVLVLVVVLILDGVSLETAVVLVVTAVVSIETLAEVLAVVEFFFWIQFLFNLRQNLKIFFRCKSMGFLSLGYRRNVAKQFTTPRPHR